MEEKAQRGYGIDSKPVRLIFLGTPNFAVPSLELLLSAGADVCLVVTQPDRPKGRGKKLSPTPVKVLAEKSHLPIYQPERIKASGAHEQIRRYEAQCAVLVAYGQLLPKTLLELFPFGTLNVHASLLPRYRGAAPVQRAILAGESKTGVTIMLLDEGMDTGPVLAQREVTIEVDDNSGTLHEKLARTGAELLVETLEKWRSGLIAPRLQDNSAATYAPPIEKGELRLHWQLPGDRLVNMIRAFDPWPGAYALLHEKRLKCYRARLLEWRSEGRPGAVLGIMDAHLAVVAGDGAVFGIGELQLQGQRRLTAPEFVRGHPMHVGSLLH